jgi:hypothetical protein
MHFRLPLTAPSVVQLQSRRHPGHACPRPQQTTKATKTTSLPKWHDKIHRWVDFFVVLAHPRLWDTSRYLWKSCNHCPGAGLHLVGGMGAMGKSWHAPLNTCNTVSDWVIRLDRRYPYARIEVWVVGVRDCVASSQPGAPVCQCAADCWHSRNTVCSWKH